MLYDATATIANFVDAVADVNAAAYVAAPVAIVDDADVVVASIAFIVIVVTGVVVAAPVVVAVVVVIVIVVVVVVAADVAADVANVVANNDANVVISCLKTWCRCFVCIVLMPCMNVRGC
jgi:hypothetical protein